MRPVAQVDPNYPAIRVPGGWEKDVAPPDPRDRPRGLPRRGPEQTTIDMRRIGDSLQSEASRMADWFRQEQHRRAFPYEIHMAVAAVERLVEEWTELRKAEAS